MQSYIVDILWHGGMWATFMILTLRLWRGRTWKATESFRLAADSQLLLEPNDLSDHHKPG